MSYEYDLNLTLAELSFSVVLWLCGSEPNYHGEGRHHDFSGVMERVHNQVETKIHYFLLKQLALVSWTPAVKLWKGTDCFEELW